VGTRGEEISDAMDSDVPYPSLRAIPQANQSGIHIAGPDAARGAFVASVKLSPRRNNTASIHPDPTRVASGLHRHRTGVRPGPKASRRF
jgi:hypothetical protein